jgi:hypothetical protein
MKKGEVKQTLNKVLAFSDNGDSIGLLEFDIRAVERYIRKKTNNNQFMLIKSQCSPTWQLPDTKGDIATIYFPPIDDLLFKRISLAVGLAYVINNYIRSDHLTAAFGLWPEVNVNKVAYFAQLLLCEREHIYAMDTPCPVHDACKQDGKCTRGDYSSSEDEICSKLKTIFTTDQPSILSVDDKEKIEKLVSEIHPDMREKGFLDYSCRLVSSYINEKWGHNKVIVKMPAHGIINNARTYSYNNGWNIQYSDTSCPLEQRVLLAHELGDIACHWIPERRLEDSETEEERKLSTYFARLLLEHRASLYFSGESELKSAKKRINQAIRRMYKDEPWLDWVFTDTD